MSKHLQDLSNAREGKQRLIMEELAVTGECFLCQDVILRVAEKYPGVASLPIHEGKHWFIKHNDFPYQGTKLHVLIVPKRHVTNIEDLEIWEFVELKEMVAWVNTTFAVVGASMILRYGETSYTGATLTHLHFHIFHGVKWHENCEAIKPKLGYQ